MNRTSMYHDDCCIVHKYAPLTFVLLTSNLLQHVIVVVCSFSCKKLELCLDLCCLNGPIRICCVMSPCLCEEMVLGLQNAWPKLRTSKLCETSFGSSVLSALLSEIMKLVGWWCSVGSILYPWKVFLKTCKMWTWSWNVQTKYMVLVFVRLCHVMH
jgi:hypothetical protein